MSEIILGFYEPGDVMTVCHRPETAGVLTDTYTHERAHEDLTVSTTTGHYEILLSQVARSIRRVGSERTISDSELASLEDCREALMRHSEITQEGFATWRELLAIMFRHERNRLHEAWQALPPNYQSMAEIFDEMARLLPGRDATEGGVAALMYALASAAMNAPIFEAFPEYRPDLSRRFGADFPPDLIPDRRITRIRGILESGAAEGVIERFDRFISEVADYDQSDLATFERFARASQRRFLTSVHEWLRRDDFPIDTGIADLKVVDGRLIRFLRSACDHFAIRDPEEVVRSHETSETTYLNHARHKLSFIEVPRKVSPYVPNLDELIAWARGIPQQEQWRLVGWISMHDHATWDVEILVVGVDDGPPIEVARLDGYQSIRLDFDTAVRAMEQTSAISIVINLIEAIPPVFSRLLDIAGRPRFLFQKQCDVQSLLHAADAHIGGGRYEVLLLEAPLPASIVVARPFDARDLDILALADPNAISVMTTWVEQRGVKTTVRAIDPRLPTDLDTLAAAWFCSLGPVGAFDWQ